MPSLGIFTFMNRPISVSKLALLLIPFSSFGSLERGQEIYSQICVTCHGPTSTGESGPVSWMPTGNTGILPKQSCAP